MAPVDPPKHKTSVFDVNATVTADEGWLMVTGNDAVAQLLASFTTISYLHVTIPV